MIIKQLRLSHFGKFENREIALKPGVNIIYGNNEAGKTTIHSFIRAMFFGIDRQRGRASKDDLYTKYMPWDTNDKFDGTMDVIVDHKEYRLLRNFYKAKREFKIIDMKTGRTVQTVQQNVSDLIPELSQSIYRNTVSIEQLRSNTDDELAMEVRNYIANLSIAKTSEIDVNRAKEHLKSRKKQIQNQLNELDAKELKRQMDIKLLERDRFDEQSSLLEELDKRVNELFYKKECFMKDETNVRDWNGDTLFESVRPKIKEYMTLKETCEKIGERYKQLTKHINDRLRVENCHKTIYKDLEEVNQLHEKIHQLHGELSHIRQREEDVIKDNRKWKNYWYTIPMLAVIVSGFIIEKLTVSISLGVATFIGGLFVYLMQQVKMQARLKTLEEDESSLDRMCIELEAKKREIFLRNHVTDDAELRYKMQMLKENQGELFEHKEERSEVEKEQIRIYTRMEHLEKDIIQFSKYYFTDITICEDLIDDLEYEINIRKTRVANERTTLQTEYEDMVREFERVKWELSINQNIEDELHKMQTKYEEIVDLTKKLEKELHAIELAMQSIEALSIHIHDSFGAQMNTRISHIVDKVTDGRYSEALMDEALNVTVRSDTDYISFHTLSAGTIAEIYLALRITIGDLLSGTKTLPLILDDAFVLFDDDRLESTLRELSQMVDRQILIFTCHKREKQIMDRLNLDYHHVNLS